MTANFIVRKIYSVVERMDGCDYSFEIIIVITVPLKEHITEAIFFFVETNVLLLKELLKQWMTARSPVKLNTLSLKEWMTATLSVTKTDIKNSSWQMFYKIHRETPVLESLF